MPDGFVEALTNTVGLRMPCGFTVVDVFHGQIELVGVTFHLPTIFHPSVGEQAQQENTLSLSLSATARALFSVWGLHRATPRGKRYRRRSADKCTPPLSSCPHSRCLVSPDNRDIPIRSPLWPRAVLWSSLVQPAGFRSAPALRGPSGPPAP
ncbi:hypothetical protein Nwat_0581 [Nitrosococcus watsonii C-113]|uniref:Uncharacterized protein n=1 Tax=Nitrosococcus watsoni (strain C-113) TaxID=105559 RepID=D8KB07_NITWC|nr:hypothetical protein Nwat_0581 [Nitrosococcus watsonii C-113]